MRSVTVSSGRGSMPRARSRRRRPTLPGRSRLRSASPRAASAPIVSRPAARSRASERGPTPGRRRTSNGARNDASRPGGTTVSPPGLRRSLAIFATTFDVATPIAALRLVAPGPTSGPPPRRPEPPRTCPRPRPGRGTPRRAPCARRSAPPRARHPDRGRVLAVHAVARADEHGVRAAAQRLGAGHRGADPELARLVVGRRDDPAPARSPPTINGFERSSGFSSSSTAAKKASRSRCPRIIFAPALSFSSAGRKDTGIKMLRSASSSASPLWRSRLRSRREPGDGACCRHRRRSGRRLVCVPPWDRRPRRARDASMVRVGADARAWVIDHGPGCFGRGPDSGHRHDHRPPVIHDVLLPDGHGECLGDCSSRRHLVLDAPYGGAPDVHRPSVRR